MESDNTTHATTLGSHLVSIEEMLHTLQKAHKEGSLTPVALYQAMQKEFTYTTRDFPPERSGAITESYAADLLAGYWRRVEKRKVAAPIGMKAFDDALGGGFQAQRLVTLLGAPGSGKTSFANQVAEQIAHEHPVFYVTSEDVPDVLLAKTLARVGKIQYSAVLYGWETHKDDINQAIKVVAERPSARLLRYLDVTAGMISLNEMRDRAVAHFEGKTGPGLIVVDYLQKMARATRESSGTRELREAVTFLTERLRAIACELNCTVLAIASMNRASGYNKNNDALAASKESGDVEYTSDTLMALIDGDAGRQESYVSKTLRIDKNRQGATKSIDLLWDANHQQFLPVSKEGR